MYEKLEIYTENINGSEVISISKINEINIQNCILELTDFDCDYHKIEILNLHILLQNNKHYVNIKKYFNQINWNDDMVEVYHIPQFQIKKNDVCVSVVYTKEGSKPLKWEEVTTIQVKDCKIKFVQQVVEYLSFKLNDLEIKHLKEQFKKGNKFSVIK